MVQAAMISITGTQQLEGEEPESIQLVTEGSYCYEPGYIRFSYVETQMTGLEGVVTTFTIEDEKTVTLRRTGKVNSMMVFELGRIDDSLYEAGPGALMLRVQTKSLGVLMNEHGGIFDLSYSIEVEYATCGLNSYHIEIRVTRNANAPAGRRTHFVSVFTKALSFRAAARCSRLRRRAWRASARRPERQSKAAAHSSAERQTRRKPAPAGA